jgi:hypothetical protein
MAEKEPRKRFKERGDRDDEEDDRPARRSRRDEDEDDEEDDRPGRGGRRPRAVGGDRPPVLFLIGLAAGAFLLLVCCGVGGWGAYSALVGGGAGGGWSVFGRNELEITSAARGPAFGFNSAPQVSWSATITAVPAAGKGRHYVVIRCGGVTDVSPVEVPPFKGATIQQSMTRPALRNTSGPLDVWIERRADPNTPGQKVSNVYRAP